MGEHKQSAAKRAIYRFNTVRVLLIDSNSFMRKILQTILNALDIRQVITADTAADAAEILNIAAGHYDRGGEVDIIMCEHRLSDTSGLNLLRHVRRHKNENVRFSPFILMGSEVQKHIVEEARDLGVTEMLVKPMSVNQVASHLLAVVDNPRPFIKAPGFFGPDRRRKIREYRGPDKRKKSDKDLDVVEEKES